jgi:hypothetical protein
VNGPAAAILISFTVAAVAPWPPVEPPQANAANSVATVKARNLRIASSFSATNSWRRQQIDIVLA